jgi:hypothetical protein
VLTNMLILEYSIYPPFLRWESYRRRSKPLIDDRLALEWNVAIMIFWSSLLADEFQEKRLVWLIPDTYQTNLCNFEKGFTSLGSENWRVRNKVLAFMKFPVCFVYGILKLGVKRG